MRKVRDGEEKKMKKKNEKKKNDDYSGPLTSLPVDLPKVDRLQRRRSCQKRVYVPIEGECLGVAWALEQTRYFTLGCPTLLVVVDHKPLVKVLYDKAMEDITNSRMFKLKERTLPWKFSIIYRPGKLNYFADGTSRNPVEPDDDETDVECETELVSEVSAMFQVKLQPLTSITFELVKSASKDDKIIQQVIMQLITGFPEDKFQV